MKRSLFFAYVNVYPIYAAVKKMMRYRNPYLIPIAISYRDFPIHLEMPMLNNRSIHSAMRGYFRVEKKPLHCLIFFITTARTNSIRIPSLVMDITS